MFARKELTRVVGIEHMQGVCFRAVIDNGGIDRRPVLLFEDDVRLCLPTYCYPECVRYVDAAVAGRGMYDVWGDNLLFTASDNSSPLENGRSYAYRFADDEDRALADAELRRVLDALDVDSAESLRGCFDELLRLFDFTECYGQARDRKRISTLSSQVLFLLSTLAAKTPGRILEIGPYVGGSSVAMAAGLGVGARPLISVEAGGAYPGHQISTQDILQDLEKNLTVHGVRDRVAIVEGRSSEPGVAGQVERLLGGDKVSLFVVDADGEVLRDVMLFSRHFRDTCLLVFDDYSTIAGVGKELAVRQGVERLKELGCLREVGVYGYGTWIGLLETAGLRAGAAG